MVFFYWSILKLNETSTNEKLKLFIGGTDQHLISPRCIIIVLQYKPIKIITSLKCYGNE